MKTTEEVYHGGNLNCTCENNLGVLDNQKLKGGQMGDTATKRANAILGNRTGQEDLRKLTALPCLYQLKKARTKWIKFRRGLLPR